MQCQYFQLFWDSDRSLNRGLKNRRKEKICLFCVSLVDPHSVVRMITILPLTSNSFSLFYTPMETIHSAPTTIDITIFLMFYSFILALWQDLSILFYFTLLKIFHTGVIWRFLIEVRVTANLLKCCIATYTIHIQLYICTCGNKINNNDERTRFFRKMYLSHFIQNGCERVAKGLCVRGELETEQTATNPSSCIFSSTSFSFSGLFNRGSWGPLALC